MSAHRTARQAVLMIAYTNYETDPRVIREAEAAAQAGFDVDFLALRRPKDPPIEMIRGVRVIRLNQRRYRGSRHFSYLLAYLQFFLRCFFTSARLFFQKRYRVIHVNNMPDALVFSTLIPRLFGAKVLLDIHDPMPDTFAWKFKAGPKGLLYRFLLWQERLSAAYSSYVLTVSDPVKHGILVDHGIPADSIHVIANFADDNLFTRREPAPIEGKVRMVFHGTILERYGLRDLVQAVARVRCREKMSVRIIGEGDFSRDLAALIETLGLQDTIDFDNRLYPLHEIPDIIRGYNLGLVPLKMSPGTNFGLPLKLLEYISLGLPVVTIRNTAISYYFEDEDCFFYEAGNVESLAEILNRIVENPELLRPHHERNARLRERFLWSNERRKYIDLLNLLSGNPVPPWSEDERTSAAEPELADAPGRAA